MNWDHCESILHISYQLKHTVRCEREIDGGIPQPLKMYGGFWYGMVLNVTHTGGLTILKKIFEKNFGGYKNYVLSLAGGWVCL